MVSDLFAGVHVDKDGHSVSLSENFGPSSNSVLTMSRRENSESPTSPRTARTAPMTMSPCGCPKKTYKAFFIFASFCFHGD